MDVHFRHAPLRENLPVLMALIGVWNRNFLGCGSLAVIPYCDGLSYFVPWLQQLDMESNGKRTDRLGRALGYSTAPVIWGGVGTGVQHAFFVDFIVPCQSSVAMPAERISALEEDSESEAVTPNRESLHVLQLANCLAQARALMLGSAHTDRSEYSPKLSVPGERLESLSLAGDQLKIENQEKIPGWRDFPGNRPSTMLLLQSLTPESLGALIALYEHKVFVQSIIWQVNAFDQWGVELGKVLAEEVALSLFQRLGDGGGTGSQESVAFDASTERLIAKVVEMQS
jgi:glucose-6-phosphate isomerase